MTEITAVNKQLTHIVLCDYLRKIIQELNDPKLGIIKATSAMVMLVLILDIFKKIKIPAKYLTEVMEFLRRCSVDCNYTKAGQEFSEEFFAAVEAGNVNPILVFAENGGLFSSDEGVQLIMDHSDIDGQEVIIEAIEIKPAIKDALVHSADIRKDKPLFFEFVIRFAASLGE